jgi:hypothetical protein
MKYPFLPMSQIEAAAENLIASTLGPPDTISLPIDLDSIIYDHLCGDGDLIFSNEEDLGYKQGEKILGVTYIRSCRVHIDRSLMSADHQTRYRFTVAHEIGHWILHRPLFLAADATLPLFDPVTEETLVSLNRNVFPNASLKPPPEEWQANQFASALLINRQRLVRAVFERFGESVLIRPPSVSLRDFARQLAAEPSSNGSLASRFNVSREAMAIALESSGLLVETPLLL